MRVDVGQTSVIQYFKLIDPTTGAPELGLTITDLDINYIRDGANPVENNATEHANLNDGFSANKMKEVGTAAPGLYRADFPDAAFVAGVKGVTLIIEGAAIDPAYIEVEIGPREANLTEILAHLLTNTGTRMADAFEKMYDVASPVLVASDVMRGTDSAATAAKLLAYIRLALRSDAGPTTDDAAELTEINADDGAGGGDYAKEDSQEAILDTGEANWLTATGFSTHSAANVWAVAVRVLTASTNLNDISAQDVWDLASSLSGAPDFGTLLERSYQFFTNKENIVDATGVVSLRTIGDGGELAAWTITDNDTTTTRTEVAFA